MTPIQHHVDETTLAAFATGSLSHPFAHLVASHLAMCPICRRAYEGHLGIAGAVLEGLAGVSVSDDVKSRLFDRLDEAEPEVAVRPRLPAPYPAPLSAFFGAEGPRWRKVGATARQAILWEGREGSLRLLHIPAGRPVPEHGHGGPEFTLVLKGSYCANDLRFGPGDIEIADDDTNHTPTAGPEEDCICLAATNAPLRFRSFAARLVQPLLRI